MNPQQQQIPPGANFMMKNNPQQHPNQMPPQQQPGGPFSQSCDMWPNQMDPLGPNSDMLTDPLGLNSDLVPEPQMGGNGPNSNQQPPHQSPGTCNMDPTSPNIPSLQGVKVPDENLTPQQLHSRELKLARLNQLQKLVFREQTMNPDCQMGDQDQVRRLSYSYYAFLTRIFLL